MPAPIKNYKKGAAWFVASLFISCLNDTVAKHLIRNANYPPLQITFCRLLIGTIFTGGYLYYKSKIKPSAYYYRYLLLGGLLAASSILWTWGLVYTSTVTATVIDFSTPLFVLMLAPRFLTEYPSSTLWRSVVGGLVGTCIMVGREGLTWHNTVLLLVMASFFFALLDLLNKKWLPEEGWGALMLFPNLIATIITAPSCYYWVPPPDWAGVSLLVALGVGSTALVYCLLRGYSYTSLASLVPLRYIELLFSALLGYVWFGEALAYRQVAGATIIIISLWWAGRQNRS